MTDETKAPESQGPRCGGENAPCEQMYYHAGPVHPTMANIEAYCVMMRRTAQGGTSADGR